MGDHFRISDILQEINSIKQGERNVYEYFTDLKVLWEKLEFLRPIPICTCETRCSCDVMKIITNYRNSKHIISFLKGLANAYTNVKTQILLMEPLPNINRVFSLVQQQERQLIGVGEISESKLIVNNVNNQELKFHGNRGGYAWRMQGRGRSRNYGKQCNFFHKMNHVTDECYSKNGFPPWMKQKYRSNASVNQIENQSSSSNLKEDRPINEEKQVVPVQSLTSHQVQQLLKILQNPDKTGQINTLGETKSEHNEGKFSWILDTGATDHSTCMRNIFTNFHKIKPIKIGLSNGSCVYANYVGTVRITKKLIIYDVFYIPSFTLNIISIQKLINHFNLQWLFFRDKCQIKDIHTWRMVGLASLIDGLYRITGEDSQFSINSVMKFKTCNIDIWHHRLGHPSNNVLDHICKDNVNIQYNKTNVCDSCHYAK